MENSNQTSKADNGEGDLVSNKAEPEAEEVKVMELPPNVIMAPKEGQQDSCLILKGHLIPLITIAYLDMSEVYGLQA